MADYEQNGILNIVPSTSKGPRKSKSRKANIVREGTEYDVSSDLLYAFVDVENRIYWLSPDGEYFEDASSNRYQFNSVDRLSYNVKKFDQTDETTTFQFDDSQLQPHISEASKRKLVKEGEVDVTSQAVIQHPIKRLSLIYKRDLCELTGSGRTGSNADDSMASFRSEKFSERYGLLSKVDEEGSEYLQSESALERNAKKKKQKQIIKNGSKATTDQLSDVSSSPISKTTVDQLTQRLRSINQVQMRILIEIIKNEYPTVLQKLPKTLDVVENIGKLPPRNFKRSGVAGANVEQQALLDGFSDEVCFPPAAAIGNAENNAVRGRGQTGRGRGRGRPRRRNLDSPRSDSSAPRKEKNFKDQDTSDSKRSKTQSTLDSDRRSGSHSDSQIKPSGRKSKNTKSEELGHNAKVFEESSKRPTAGGRGRGRGRGGSKSRRGCTGSATLKQSISKNTSKRSSRLRG